ncbi:class I glutamine amidotransferase-like protein [Coniella lustricola]|uniref:Class I glutamine amidotransferase-like protein n=1 Tax=Coniella lustricola TaxID=2025994 RepID=A0A2T3AIV0_9PEZI|nr:class I glutamine amidotransferase-like protein [Coniella lustricola]
MEREHQADSVTTVDSRRETSEVTLTLKSNTMAASKSLHIGVFLPSSQGMTMGTQLLDLASIDFLWALSREYLRAVTDVLPSKDFVTKAPEIKVSYIGAAGPAGTLVPLSSSLTIQLTHHFSDNAVAPGSLDIVHVPGPDPKETWTQEALAWLKSHADHPGVDVLSVCTGIYVCGAAGLLTDKEVCGPSGLQQDLKVRFEAQNPRWVGDSVRWTRDGNFWSSGGVTNGNDLVVAFCRESGRFDPQTVELMSAIFNVGDRARELQ